MFPDKFITILEEVRLVNSVLTEVTNNNRRTITNLLKDKADLLLKSGNKDDERTATLINQFIGVLNNSRNTDFPL